MPLKEIVQLHKVEHLKSGQCKGANPLNKNKVLLAFAELIPMQRLLTWMAKVLCGMIEHKYNLMHCYNISSEYRMACTVIPVVSRLVSRGSFINDCASALVVTIS